MKKHFLFFLLTSSMMANAQRPQGENKREEEKKGEIYGNVLDSLTNESVSYATVLAYSQPANQMVGGVVTDDQGNFSIQNLPFGLYTLKVSFIGYNPKFIEGISLEENKTSHLEKDILLAATMLDVVEVIGDVPEFRYEIDKKIVNVEDQQNTAGQSALEVLENVPSITVNADGTVSLRGSSSFTLLIDGVPTILDPNDALAAIPASTIKEIEIITNPSAKFDAEGTSGVINIITKKNKLQGSALLADLTGGTFGNNSADLSLSIKRKTIAFDLSANYSSRKRPNEETEERITNYDSLTNKLVSSGTSDFIRTSWKVGGGFQWNPNNSHNLVIRYDYNPMVMVPFNNKSFWSYDNGNLVNSFYTDQDQFIEITQNSSSLFYQYNIKRDQNHFITVRAVANLKYVTQNDSTLSFNQDGSLTAGNVYTELGPSNMYRFNVDYRLPVGKLSKFETGLQAQFGQSGDIGRNYVYNDSSQLFSLNELFSSDVEYVRNVHAAYAIFGGQFKQLGYQMGMRMEYTQRTITSTSAISFTSINRPDWFPSAHLSYSFKNKGQLMLSYSRRIERPRSWFFEPFVTWESPFQVRSGNPNLQPTYINALETSFMKPLKKKGFFSFEAYYRSKNNELAWVNTVYEDGILIKQPYNIGFSQSLGAEGMFDFNFTKWYGLNASFNAYIFDLAGQIEGQDYGARSYNWNASIRNSFNFKGWMLQFSSRYKSGSVEPQGRSIGAFTQDISLKKSFYKNKLTFNLQARNAFLTSRQETFVNTTNVSIHELSVPKGPFISLTVALKLNNYQKFYERDENLDDF